MFSARKLVARLSNGAIGAVRNLIARPHPEPIFILGNEKSGTTVIAAALGAATGLKVTLDIPGTWEPVQSALHSGRTTLDQVIARNRRAFSNDIIKEPVLSFEYDKLIRRYPGSQYVLIVRDPRANIRSILNRLRIPGDLEELKPADVAHLGKVWIPWSTVLSSGWLGFTEGNYVSALAYRWKYIAETYLAQPNAFELIRYEDFVRQKNESIHALATRLGRRVVGDTSEVVQQQFQPKTEVSRDAPAFFGERNLHRIIDTCGNVMERFGYEA